MKLQLSSDDLSLLKSKGISISKLESQLESFATGFPFIAIEAAAEIGNGIKSISNESIDQYLDIWDRYLKTGKEVVKFVPASGAASRMFKDLFEYLESPDNSEPTGFISTFIDQLDHFAFYNALDAKTREVYNQSLSTLKSNREYKKIITLLLTPEGLNYGNLPKGLLLFHKYGDYSRTPIEEHLAEGALYAGASSGLVNIHFTVSTEHKPLFQQLVQSVSASYQKKLGVKFNISYSEQKPSTDTIAADEHNNPFRDNGQLLFRPGGHGALIENLNDLESADIVFIKNIDNIVPDKHKASTVIYKKLIAGILVNLQKDIFEYIRLIDGGKYSRKQLLEIIHFMHHELFIRTPELKLMEDAELALYLKNKLNRPIRVCGMVKNEGEPGGGPFICTNPDGSISAQILESSQIDMKDPKKKILFEQGGYFNPVDLVCAVKDYKGNHFDLTRYVDPQAGFISQKSKSGKVLQALELPGLWNGAMSDWNTIFVEIPASTFNPVKTVNDLLRTQHQG